jgi:hypothetical protein
MPGRRERRGLHPGGTVEFPAAAARIEETRRAAGDSQEQRSVVADGELNR